MNFGQSITVCMSKYADFSGRASKSEFWWFYLFGLMLQWGGNIMGAATFGAQTPMAQFASTAVTLALLVPQMAAQTRRLHDTGRSGWNWLWCLTIVGIIPYVIWLASHSEEGENKYGAPQEA